MSEKDDFEQERELLITWLLDSLHDPELAEEAIALRPDVGGIWNTLGVARYRVGDWSGAIEALNESMDLRSGGDALDWRVA